MGSLYRIDCPKFKLKHNTVHSRLFDARLLQNPTISSKDFATVDF